MKKLPILQQAENKKDLSKILGVKPSFLTHTLYVINTQSQYYQFKIPKRSGGERLITAPTAELKDIQSRLSELLLDCIDEISHLRNRNGKKKDSLAHGFCRDRSIITNAKMHINNNLVLNLDLESYFESFNFGRVRGFFIKNKNFELHPDISTVIAKIACFDNTLPQGSPCSPVIANLITHSLDVRLSQLANRISATYTRYADDITISTRREKFPNKIVTLKDGEYRLGNKLVSEIKRAGFLINNKKTRIQYRNSRQDVTGLVVNRKLGIKREYRRRVRAMCHELFRTGSFYISVNGKREAGKINALYGMLNHIDTIDQHNRKRTESSLDHRYQLKNHGLQYKAWLNSREKTFSTFLYYKNFYGNEKPTILCEGKTDNIYIKCAISILFEKYPLLASSELGDYNLKLSFVEYSKRTKFLLDLHGGTSYLKRFVQRYSDNYNFYDAPQPSNPVIIVLDNDNGPTELFNYLSNNRTKFPNCPKSKDGIRKKDFLHVGQNLYIITTPLIDGKHSEMEDFFEKSDKEYEIQGKKFDPKKDGDTDTTYGKNTFATKIVKEKKNQISFSGFEPLLTRITNAINHHASVIAAKK